LAARAGSPSVSSIDPQGGQRGSEFEVVISGERLQDAKGLLFYSPGVEVTSLEVIDAKKIKAKLKIASDCPFGEKQLRIWTSTGVSEMHLFYVGPFPTVIRAGESHDAAHAQPIPLNVTVSGVIQYEEVDYFSVEAKKGERITAEVEGMRLGNTMFDPWLAITRKGGGMLASCDDTALLMQDPIISILAPEDGTYIIQLRDSTYGGSDRCRYRLHAGTFPQPTAIYPPGGPAGGTLAVRFIGDVRGPVEQKITLPALENGISKTQSVFAEIDGQAAPSPIPFRVSPFPNVLEVEPNNDAAHATKTDLSPPLAFNGIISEKGDIDFFRFKAAKDQTFDFKVYARALRSPLDSVLCIYDGQGRQLASNDDSGGPDSYLRFRIPADGEYCISVTDQIRRGGPDFTYRVEVTPVQPELVLAMPQPVKDSQERQTIVVPRGNRYGTVLRARRADTDGGIVVSSNDLPPGVTMQAAPMQPNSDSVPIVFEAAGDAAVGAKACQFAIAPADPANKVAGRFEHVVDLVLGEPNNSVYYQARLDKLAVAVAEEAPFKIRVVKPKVPIVQNGSMNLKVAVERKEGFHGDIEVSMLYTPPGINAQNSVKIPGDKNEGVIPLSANGDAPVRQWQIAVNGFTDSGNGQVWACSSFAPVEVSAPFVTAKIERGYVEQGQSATMTCTLAQSKPFEGKATIKLLNLPDKVSALDMQITSADQAVQFPVTAEKGSPVGQKKDLFCLVTIVKDGEPIVHNIGQGGILRIGKAPEKQ
jgi:hypothetical protein